MLAPALHYPLGDYVERSGSIRYVVHEEPRRAFHDVERGEDLDIRDQEIRDVEITEKEKKLIADAIDDAASPLPLNDELAARGIFLGIRG